MRSTTIVYLLYLFPAKTKKDFGQFFVIQKLAASSSEKNFKKFRKIQTELIKFDIRPERNDLELVLVHFNFDIHQTVNAFKNDTAKEILNEWKTSTRKKQIHEDTRTSTPKKSLNTSKSTEMSLASTTSSEKNSHEEKKTSSINYDQIKHDMEKCDAAIKDYEKEMKICTNNNLLNYYIASASKLREQSTMFLEIYKKQETDSKLTEEIQKISLKVDYLLQQNKDRLKNELDCWDTSSTRTKEEQDDFKSKLITYYNCGSPKMRTIKCMILNKYFDRNFVRASHIWKAATKGVGLTAFKLNESDVNNERNGLLLYESIEKAFDYKKLCFLYDPFAGNLLVKILCSDLRQTFIVDDPINRKNFNELRTFNDIDNAVLQLPPNIFPYRRLLNWHGRCSFKTAKANKWINKDEHLEDFFHLSDLISLPGEDFNE
ncbi:unnamed protein product [Rotaria sp. Silwood2]|nr:unnamed protein product [Rotaria sp. Silwood2]